MTRLTMIERYLDSFLRIDRFNAGYRTLRTPRILNLQFTISIFLLGHGKSIITG